MQRSICDRQDVTNSFQTNLTLLTEDIVDFTVKENPGMASKQNAKAGLNGLFYYYHTMAKCLGVYGEPVIKDSKGTEHRWAKELSDQILLLQHEEGHWQNTSERWWENLPALDTAYAIVSLCECAEAMKKDVSQAPGK